MNSVHIEKLCKDNFETWKLQIEAILIKNDHWSYVDGSNKQPKLNEAGDNLNDIRSWELVDLKARADIILAINPSELSHIKHCKTSHEVWKKLHNVYQSKGPARKATLLKKLLFTKMTDGDNMLDHITNFFNIVDRLYEMEVVVAEDLLTILLLYSIPDSYENFRCAIETRDELPSPELLKIKLIEEFDARMEKQNNGRDSQNAFLTSHRNNNWNNNYRSNRPKFSREKFEEKFEQKQNTRKPFRYNCSYCDIKGHKAADCRKKLADKRQGVSKVDEEALITEVMETISIEQVLAVNLRQSDEWCFDSGATSHMCRERDMFSNFNEAREGKVRLGDETTVDIKGEGSVRLIVLDKNGERYVRLENVLYVPELNSNLLSVSKITAKGLKVIFGSSTAQVKNKNGEVILIAKKRGNLYFVYAKSNQENSVATCVAENCEINKWHRRFGHLNEHDLQHLMKNNMVLGVKFKENEKMNVCETCIEGKHTQNPFPKEASNRADKLLGRIHSDVCGPIRTQSLGGAKYFATFIDDKSRYTQIYLLKQKNEVKEAFLKFKAYAEKETECKIKILRTDNGLEYCGTEFEDILEREGIKRERTVEYTPQQNGVAERMNRTLVEMARCMMLSSHVSPEFWAEAVNTATHIRNRCPTRSLQGITPYEAYYKKKPNVSYFKQFGCKAYFLDKTPNKGKFDPRSKECIFVGYSNESKAYRLWNPKTKKILKSRDVRFIENSEIQENQEVLEIDLINPNLNQYQEHKEAECEQRKEVDEAEQDEDDVPVKHAIGRPRLIRDGKRGRPRKVFNTVPTILTSDNKDTEENRLTNDIETPTTVKEALSGESSEDWKEAMNKEFEGLIVNKTWKLVERPPDRKVIKCRWVFKTKYSSNGKIERRKARLVAKGCSQQPGIDYHETYAPVARMSTIRILIALAVTNYLTIYQMDITMAYINGDLEEEIFMEQAEGFINPGEEHLVCCLKKSLYGLKQSGRQWHKKINDILQAFGMIQLNADKCFYYVKSQDSLMFLAIYVDDIIIAAKDINIFYELEKYLSKELDVKILGKIKYCLGIEFEQDPVTKHVKIFQRKYILDILKRFGMETCKPVSTPFDVSIKLTKRMCPSTKEEIKEMEKYPYQNLIGSLMYLATSTRPDIAYTVSTLSQFNINPGKAHWLAAKRTLRYLRSTINDGLLFKQTNNPLIAFVDADWGNNIDDRISYTGYYFKLANAAITWESRKQRSVALSSTEAEYIALTEASKEVVYLRNFLKEIDVLTQNSNPTDIYNDNQGAQKLIVNPIYHSRTKHIDIRYHFIRNIYDQGELNVLYCPTEEMSADILTKPLSGPKHRKFSREMGLT